MKKTLTIPTITCGHCLKSIERELHFAEGVEYVQGNIDSKAVMVEYTDDVALNQARTVLTEAGYAPTN